MNREAIKAIIRKDIRSISASTQMWLPMVLVPLIFVVGIPLAIIIIFSSQDVSTYSNNIQFVERLLKSLPEGALKNEILAFPTLNQKMAFFMLNYSFAPMFLLLPVMVSSIIAGNSFAGEKERKTLETLLFSPVQEKDLLLAKVLASFIPSIGVSVLGFVLYGIVVDGLGYSLFNKMIFPNPVWFILMLWLIPAITLLTIFMSVFISAKVKGFQESQQMSILVILPIIGLFIAQMSGAVFLDPLILLVIGSFIFVADGLLIRFSSRLFNRQKLFMSQV